MKFSSLIAVLFCIVSNVNAVPVENFRSKRQADECSTLNVDPAQCSAYWVDQKPPLLIVSLDGFRSDYLNRTYDNNGQTENASPTIHRLGRCGIQAATMIPVFPSLTFPNHYSIVTGLYPESHGIVANSFHDPILNANFSLSSPDLTNPRWWFGEPVWYTIKRQGKISATYFWPGSDIDDPVRAPNYWLPYDGNVPFDQRIQQVLDWLLLPIQERPHFLTLYLEEPDHIGHNNGPQSSQVGVEVHGVDQQLQALLDGLDQNGLLGCIDIIVVSDHGMAPTPAGQYVLTLEPLVPDIGSTSLVYDGVLTTIRPRLDTQDEQDRIAYGIECFNPNMRIYNKWEFPRRHHYVNSERIPSLVLDTTVSWRVFRRSEYFTLAGNHGWDNLNKEMQAIFVAQGPSFQKGTQVRSFHNIDLYNLMCAMVGVSPAPNNGTWGALHHLLLNPPADPSPAPVTPPSILNFPLDQATYDQHLQRNKCNLLSGLNDLLLDSTLNLTQAAMDTSFAVHSPWGLPQMGEETNNIQVLVSNDYITGFDVMNGLPSWVSYTLNKANQTVAEQQWRLDVRLEMGHRSICDRFPNGIATDNLLKPLFPAGFSSTASDSNVDTNVIEISSLFTKYWDDLQARISQLSNSGNEIHVVVGTVRNSPSSSLFYILSTCKAGITIAGCSIADLDMQTFILPTHARYNRDCISFDDFFSTHVATLKDIESVTGLRFFPQLSFRDKVDLLSRTPFESNLIATPGPSGKP